MGSDESRRDLTWFAGKAYKAGSLIGHSRNPAGQFNRVELRGPRYDESLKAEKEWLKARFGSRAGRPTKEERNTRWRAFAESDEFRVPFGYVDKPEEKDKPLTDNACNRLLARYLRERFPDDWNHTNFPVDEYGDFEPGCLQDAANLVRNALQIDWAEFR